MKTTTSDIAKLEPLGHVEAMSLLAVELQQTLDLLGRLDDSDWAAQTDCPDWDVFHMYLHVLGACEASTSMRENIHQMRAARSLRTKDGRPLEAGLSATQVKDRADLSPTELVDRLDAIADETVRKRTRMPSLLRRMRMKIDGPVHETWNLGYLIDTIYLRDMWMHRVDASRATGREPVLTADHDGRLIEDVVAEWARRHGEPFSLTLTGPAGGTYESSGVSGGSATAQQLELDAVEFCLMLAGRLDGSGLLTTVVPF